MNPRIRAILRWLHIVSGMVILCYIYSPFASIYWFQTAVKFIVVPWVVLSGFWLWKPRGLQKLLGSISE